MLIEKNTNCHKRGAIYSRVIRVSYVIVSFVAIASIFWFRKSSNDTLIKLYLITDKYTSNPPIDRGHKFQIKHIFHHGTGKKYHEVHRRLDITPEVIEKVARDNYPNPADIDIQNLEDVYNMHDWPQAFANEDPWTIELPIRSLEEKSRAVRLKHRHEPNFIESYLSYALSVQGDQSILSRIHLEWEETDVAIPDVRDKQTVVSLATMSSNAYVRFPKSDDEKKKLDWIDVGRPWVPDDEHDSINFGWNESGLRGHVFVSENNKTVVISIKGTSGAGIPGGGSDETTAADKTNDNLLFLCCCARVSYLWTTVCDCYRGTYTCDQKCLEKEHLRRDRYYQAAIDIYQNVTQLYDPETTDIWVTGHSLGGALASLLGRTFGLPAVAFEAPGEMLATRRLHLPQPPGLPKYQENIWHFGNTGDPIYMGVCNGVSSSCNAAGYALETACHTGKQCIYDVVSDKGWKVNLLNHRIHTLIDDVILDYNETAPCVYQPPCTDCFNWKYVSS